MNNPTDSVEYILGRMEAKLDQVLGLEKRVCDLEAFRSKAAGYIAGASGVCGALGWIVSHFLGK